MFNGFNVGLKIKKLIITKEYNEILSIDFITN